MHRKSDIQKFILLEMRKRKTVTFNELYPLQRFSKRGVRNAMYKLMDRGLAEKIAIGKRRVKFQARSITQFFDIRPR
jgi:predicted transcriptional regulator